MNAWENHKALLQQDAIRRERHQQEPAPSEGSGAVLAAKIAAMLVMLWITNAIVHWISHRGG